ncbi:MAG: ferrous iron transport protein B [Candidatus Kapabacteria bacterium]|nr:ferrous iron transport protein B [Candidatus Kapabacteria bacterium]
MKINDKLRTIAIVGQPNAGKSTLFNVLSDTKASTSNFAGTTVDLKQTIINIYNESFRLIDLPGSYSLNPNDKAEQVTLDYIMNEQVDLIINLIDSTLLSRSLVMTVELIETGIPMIVGLNMLDESMAHGIFINKQLLEQELRIPVIPITAIFGKGVKNLIDECSKLLSASNHNPAKFDYSAHLENFVVETESILATKTSNLNVSDRFLAIKALEYPVILGSDLRNLTSSINKIASEQILKDHKFDIFESISYERHHIAIKITDKVQTLKSRHERPLIEKLDDWLLHPFWGYVFLLLYFILQFSLIFILGDIISKIIEVPLDFVESLYTPLKLNSPFLYYMTNGIYQGIEGAIGVVLPYLLPLVLITSFFEETGYISRVAFLIDGFMHKIGLHGKSVVPFILGFGCSVPAIYATRIIENKIERKITASLIPLIPCSARISVIFALAAARTGPLWTVLIFFYVIIIIAIVGKIISKFSGKPIGLILEIPNLKIPSLKIPFQKTKTKLMEFIRVALLYLVLGSFIMGMTEYLNLTIYINKFFSPLVSTILGLPEQLGSTLIFGFLRKELVIVMMTQALGISSLDVLPMTNAQILTFTIFVTLYLPCLSTMLVLKREFGRSVILFSSTISIILAFLSALVFKFILT